MQKINLLFTSTIVASAIVLSGCLPGGNETADQSNTPTPAAAEQTSESAFSTIADAMQQGDSIYCAVAHDERSESYELWLREGKMRMRNTYQTTEAGTATEQTAYMINDGSTMYMWVDSEDTGMMMSVENIEDQTVPEQTQQPDMPDFTQESEVQSLEDQGYRINCKPQTIAADQFTPPNDVEFQNLSQLMQDAQMMMEQDASQSQGGTQGMTPEQEAQMEELMQQMENYGQ